MAAFLGGLAQPVLVARVLGPVFFPWVCPWGLTCEMLDKLSRREL